MSSYIEYAADLRLVLKARPNEDSGDIRIDGVSSSATHILVYEAASGIFNPNTTYTAHECVDIMYSSPAVVAVNGPAKEYCIAPAIYNKESDIYQIDTRASCRMVAGDIVTLNYKVREELISEKKNLPPKAKKVTVTLSDISEGLYYTVSTFEEVKYPIVFDPPATKSFVIFVPCRAKVRLGNEKASNVRLKYVEK